jgi:hypothetical protein
MPCQIHPIREFTCERKVDAGVVYQAYHLKDAAKVLALHSIDTAAQVSGRNDAKGGYMFKSMSWAETERFARRKDSLHNVTKMFTGKKTRTSGKDRLRAEVAITQQLLQESNQAPVMIDDIGPFSNSIMSNGNSK